MKRKENGGGKRRYVELSKIVHNGVFCGNWHKNIFIDHREDIILAKKMS